MSLQKPEIHWRAILLEASFVVFGVVLALAANEWRRALADRRDAATAMQSITEELHANRGAVLESVQYHLQLTDSLVTFARLNGSDDSTATPPSPELRLFSRGFFLPATLLHTAWDAAAARDAVRHMQYRDVLHLAQIYEEQDRYRRQSEEIGQIVFTHLFASGLEGMARNYSNLSTILSTMWFRECQLLHRYDTVLTQLNGHAGSPSPVPEPCRYIPRN